MRGWTLCECPVCGKNRRRTDPRWNWLWRYVDRQLMCWMCYRIWAKGRRQREAQHNAPIDSQAYAGVMCQP